MELRQLRYFAKAAETLSFSHAANCMHIAQSSYDAAQLRQQVTSPNGTTEAAIQAFLNGGFVELVDTAVQSAASRSQELAQQLSE